MEKTNYQASPSDDIVLDMDWCDACSHFVHGPCDCGQTSKLFEEAEELANRYHIPAWDFHAVQMRDMILRLIQELK